MEDNKAPFYYAFKFKLGQTVYYPNYSNLYSPIKSGTIIKISIECYGQTAIGIKEPEYTLNNGNVVYENYMFETAEEAKNYLIELIKNQKVEEK